MLEKLLYRIHPVTLIRKSDYFDRQWYTNKYGIPSNKAASHYLKIGYREGYEPSKLFSGADYILCNPDVQGVNPLLHYEAYGKKEKRILKPARVSIPSEALPENHTLFYETELNNPKRMAIFACSDTINGIPDYVAYYLMHLSKICDGIVLVSSDSLRDERQLDKVREYVSYARFIPHKGSDFMSYKLGLEYLAKKGILANLEELYLVNDNCYGPVNGFEGVIEQMNERSCDFWGLLDSTDTRYHLLPFFYAFRSQVLKDPMFMNFFDRVKENMSAEYIVFDLVRQFTSYLSQKYTSDSYLKDFCVDGYENISGNRNGMLWPYHLLIKGFPLIDRSALSNAYTNPYDETSKAFSYIKESNPTLYQIIIRDMQKQSSSSSGKQNINALGELFNREYVSFDIFDTLITRPFASPQGVFEYIEKKYERKGFAHARVMAEQRARIANKSKEDINIYEIYEQIPEKYKDLLDVEMETEASFCKANPETLALYNRLKQAGKKIIITSDMYLPEKALGYILYKNGISGYEQIFVSNNSRKTKATGSLYRHIFDELHITGSQMSHIGDNVISDIQRAKEFGINTYRIVPSFEALIDSPANYKYTHFWNIDTSLPSSIHMALLANRNQQHKQEIPYFRQLGYSLGGPIVMSFMNFICKEAKENGIDRFFFSARDGYLMNHVYKRYFKPLCGIEASYVYLTRAVILSSTLNYQKEPRYLKTILKLASKDIKGVMVTDNSEQNLKEYKKFSRQINEWASVNLDALKSHLFEAAGDSKNIAVVDTTTGKFTSLMGAKSVLGDRIKMGFFSGTFNNDTRYVYETLAKSFLKPEWEKEISLSELMMSSPESGILSLDADGYPVYEEDVNLEREQRYIEIITGIDEYIEDFLSVFPLDDELVMEYEEWIAYAHDFLQYRNIVDDDYLSTLVFAKEAISSQDDIKFTD